MKELSTKVELTTSKMDEVVATVNENSNRIAAIEGALSNMDANNLFGTCINEI